MAGWKGNHSRRYLRGIIRDFYKGNGGFGYDPLFYLPQYGKTMAEISMEEKNKISHRGKAIQALLNELKNYSLNRYLYRISIQDINRFQSI